MLRFQYFFGCAFEHDRAALAAAFGTHIDDPISVLDDVQVVFNNHDCVASIHKAVDDLRRMMTPNGKIYSRKRLQLPAREQKSLAQAIKRARFMGLLPYVGE